MCSLSLSYWGTRAVFPLSHAAKRTGGGVGRRSSRRTRVPKKCKRRHGAQQAQQHIGWRSNKRRHPDRPGASITVLSLGDKSRARLLGDRLGCRTPLDTPSRACSCTASVCRALLSARRLEWRPAGQLSVGRDQQSVYMYRWARGLPGPALHGRARRAAGPCSPRLRACLIAQAR
jgi:hypothetical protein